MLYGGSNLASAADLRSGEIRVIFFSISVVNEGDNYADREGLPSTDRCSGQERADALAQAGVTFMTKKRRNMKAQVLAEWDNMMLSKLFIIETINGQLKTLFQIEHARHRSIKGFLLTVLGGVIAYCLKWKKPSLKVFYSEEDFPMTA